MRLTLPVVLSFAVSMVSGVASADMPADDCSVQEDCSSCSPDGVKEGYCEGGECVEGDPADCGSGCNAAGSPSRLGPTALVLAGVLGACAIAWSKKKRSRSRR